MRACKVRRHPRGIIRQCQVRLPLAWPSALPALRQLPWHWKWEKIGSAVKAKISQFLRNVSDDSPGSAAAASLRAGFTGVLVALRKIVVAIDRQAAPLLLCTIWPIDSEFVDSIGGAQPEHEP